MSTLETHVDRAFGKLERRTERLLAGLRLLALLVLALAFGLIGPFEQGRPIMVPLVGLALNTVATFVFTGRKRFRPWSLWLFASIDVALLSHCLVMLAAANGRPLQLALETPATLLIFIFLTTAAVRHRPLLILYIGGSFMTVWETIWLWVFHAGSGETWTPAGPLKPALTRRSVARRRGPSE